MQCSAGADVPLRTEPTHTSPSNEGRDFSRIFFAAGIAIEDFAELTGLGGRQCASASALADKLAAYEIDRRQNYQSNVKSRFVPVAR